MVIGTLLKQVIFNLAAGGITKIISAGIKSVRANSRKQHEESQYLELLANILESGEDRDDRTGVGVRGIFSSSMQFNLEGQFPLLTTKKLHFKSIVHELLWFLRGETNTKYLNEHGVTIWDEWADANGELGPIYGAQWRKWGTAQGKNIDQLSRLISDLRENPFSRRHLLNTWNVGELDKMALPPCHILAQFYVSKRGGLSCQFYQRSVDVFLGLPFNIASYALLTYIIASMVGLFPEKIYFMGGDVHLYNNHFEQARQQLQRQPHPFPSLYIKPSFINVKEMEKLAYSDFLLENYTAHPSLRAPIAV